jgi:hypothetical protein
MFVKIKLHKLIMLVIGICVIGSVGSVSAETNIGGGGNAVTNPCSTSRPATCYNAKLGTGSGDSLVQGVRVSVVDKYGNRIPGTTSIDYVQNSGHANQISTSPYLKFFQSGKYTKNEILAGKASGASASGRYAVTHLGELPTFMNIGPNTVIEDYLKAKKVNRDYTKLKQLFMDPIGYDPKKFPANDVKTHSLLFEPLTFMRVTKYPVSGSPTITNYFGTVTEVSKMMVEDGTILWTGYFGKMLPLAIYVRDYKDPITGATQTNRAGLQSISAWVAANKSDYSTEILTSNGTAAGHFWVSELIEEEKDPCEVNPNKLPECCALPQNKNKLPECCGLEENKNKPECNPDLCTFTLDLSCPGDCDESTTGYIKDIEDWQCIFGSRTATDANIRDHFYKWGNRYCSMFCRESLTYEFPNGNMTVSAGSHFTIGDTWYYPNWGPVHFTGRSECRTTSDTGSIRWDLFEKDWAPANDTVKSRWDTYQIAIKQDAAVSSSSSSGKLDCNWTCDRYHPTYPCGTAEKPSTCGGGCAAGSYKSTTMYPASASYDGKNITPGSWCSNSRPNFDVPGKRSSYLSAVNARDTLESNLRQCNDWERGYEEFEPVIGSQYEEAVYGGHYYNLSKVLERRTQTHYFINGNSTPSIDTYKRTRSDYRYVCNTTGVPCVKGPSVGGSLMVYPTNDWIRQFTTKEYDYTLPASVYRYVLKPSGESVNQKPGAGENYVDLGYSNLPIHYSRATGSYDIFLQYTSLGPNHNFNKFIFEGAELNVNYGESLSIYTWLFENNLTWMIADCGEGGHHLSHYFGAPLIAAGRLNEFLDSGCAKQYGCKLLETRSPYRVSCPGDIVDSRHGGSSSNYKRLMQCIAEKRIVTASSEECDTKYDCKYNVRNSLMDNPNDPTLNPQGIDVVYRTISLTNPFPGKNGNGRTPGSNWNSSSLIKQYITNNRNLSNPERIYFDREPMYEINLTPVVIKEIRTHNRKQAAYNRGGYADFELNCGTGTGRECKSYFIRDVFSKYFISNRCGMSSNWNACLNSDKSKG